MGMKGPESQHRASYDTDNKTTGYLQRYVCQNDVGLLEEVMSRNQSRLFRILKENAFQQEFCVEHCIDEFPDREDVKYVVMEPFLTKVLEDVLQQNVDVSYNNAWGFRNNRLA